MPIRSGVTTTFEEAYFASEEMMQITSYININTDATIAHDKMAILSDTWVGQIM